MLATFRTTALSRTSTANTRGQQWPLFHGLRFYVICDTKRPSHSNGFAALAPFFYVTATAGPRIAHKPPQLLTSSYHLARTAGPLQALLGAARGAHYL